MPKGTRTPPRVDMSRDPVLGDRFTRRDAGRRSREIEEGQARVAVGDRALNAMKGKADAGSARLAAATTPAPAAARPANVQPAKRDLLRDGTNALVNNRERLRRMEEEAEGKPRQNYAEGGYVTKAQTLNMPACSKGGKRK